MEGKEEANSCSSSSFITELFGSKEPSPSSSSSIFYSIFSAPSKPYRKEYSSFYEKSMKKFDSTIKRDSLDDEGKSEKAKIDDTSAFNQQEVSQPPCQLSSSIYYGGQDIVYVNPHITKNTPRHSTLYNKNKDEDDDGLGAIGNWWQGSVYY
ncbi:hypothetical protein SSX86_026621 [Deinandra increscens subsp. villosa]|uniref:Uncharacterized protein n=1 Tax=Deinandra increscens subsp. villosa TaxID=3103831 RepID=A0AAP0CKM2_9ASTR